MLVTSSVSCLVAGAVLAALAPRRPVAQATMEGLGGSLIVGGLCLLGSGLPLFQ